jgi:anionic cell wall polymer biosynthesis LytR-Cps2A-Psr (LCP) family protein
MRYTDPFERPPLVIDIPAGHQLLDGETAIHFMRFRSYHDGDLSRNRNQQAFIRSAIRQSLGPHLPRVVESAFENINSDISIRTALHLATRAIGMDPENIRTHSMPIRRQCYDFIHPSMTGIAEMLAEIYSMELDIGDIEDDEDDEYYDDDEE